MSKKYCTSGEVAKILGFDKDNRQQVHRIVKNMGLNLEKDKNEYYKFDEEAIESLKMYVYLIRNTKITYKDLKSLEKIIDNISSKAECVQKTYEIITNYDCTANYVHTLRLFYASCDSILGLSDEDKELLEEITGDINIYPYESETLQSMYNYYLYQAYVIDVVIDLSKLELDPDTDFWDLDVVKGYGTYIFNTDFNRPPITEKINEFFMCVLMGIKYDTASKNNALIKKLTLLLKELNKFHDQTKIKYDTCQYIFLHAIMLLSLHISDDSEIV